MTAAAPEGGVVIDQFAITWVRGDNERAPSPSLATAARITCNGRSVFVLPFPHDRHRVDGRALIERMVNGLNATQVQS